MNYCYFNNYQHGDDYIRDIDVSGSTLGAMCLPACIKNVEAAWLCTCEYESSSNKYVDINFTGNSCRDDGIYC